MHSYGSWGRFPAAPPARVVPVFWRDPPPDLSAFPETVLAYGYGRSYGDSCLNTGGALLDASFLRRFIAFDASTGVIRCEAGLTLGEILKVIVPRGYFLPVTPGTQYVSVGGAVANDIHGKNHHRAGTFGCHVVCFELLRSDGQRLVCSANENSDLFRATIGGLGLTGLILWAEFKIKPISSAWMCMEQLKLRCLDEFFEVSERFDRGFEYTVAWLDCMAGGNRLGRGLYLCGNHEDALRIQRKPAALGKSIRVCFDMPEWCLNALTIRLLNSFFYHAPRARHKKKHLMYDRFFFHLDCLRQWHRLYGKKGLLEYQFVVPDECAKKVITEILKRVQKSGEGSMLSILKRFGDRISPGMLSFPRPGLTMAMDFPNHQASTLRLLDSLDALVMEAGGAVYPAKDARMSNAAFQSYYPQWQAFARFIDGRFSSNFWRRVTGQIQPV